MSFFKKILGNDPIKPLNKIADQVEALEQSYAKLTDEELRGKTQQFKDRLKRWTIFCRKRLLLSEKPVCGPPA